MLGNKFKFSSIINVYYFSPEQVESSFYEEKKERGKLTPEEIEQRKEKNEKEKKRFRKTLEALKKREKEARNKESYELKDLEEKLGINNNINDKVDIDGSSRVKGNNSIDIGK